MQKEKKVALLLSAVLLVTSMSGSLVAKDSGVSGQTINAVDGNASASTKISLHIHGNWKYEAIDNQLIAKCGAGTKCTTSHSLLIAAKSMNYSQIAVEPAVFEGDIDSWKEHIDKKLPKIEYYSVQNKGETTGGTKVTSDHGLPKDAGYYYAKAEVGTAENTAAAVKAFEIEKVSPKLSNITVTGSTKGKKLLECSVSGTAINNENGQEIAGTWAFKNGDTQLLISGNYEVIFTPTDTKNYEIAKASCHIVLGPDQPNPEEQAKCTIKYDTNGADPVPDDHVTVNTTIRLPSITKPGYELEGWRKESEKNMKLYKETMLITTSDILHAEWKKKSSSSGSSSSSNPVSSSQLATANSEATKAEPVIIDGKKYEIGTQKVSGDKTTFTVDQTQFISNVEKAASGSEIVFPVTSSTNTVKAQLNLQNVKDMSDKSISFIVENNKVTYTVPTGAIDTEKVAQELGEENLKNIPVEVILEKADKNTMSKVENAIEGKGKGEVIGTPMTFEMKASANGKEVVVDSFNSYVTNSLEVNAKEAEEITTAVIVMPDGTMRHVPTNVYTKDNKYLADINSKTNGTYVLIKNNVSYSDAEGKWYESVANELGSRMITQCLDKENTNTIQGEKAITREEFAALLVNALGLPQASNAVATFSDVAGSNYTAEIGAAYEYGIINGVTETTFAPNKTITRQEAMAMLQRAAKIAEFAGTGQEGDVLSFKDASKVSDWAQEAAAFNVENGLIVGSNGQIKPQDTITRAESMTVTLRLLQKSNLIDIRVEA